MKQENKYSLPLGTQRYRVEFCDEAEAIRLAAQDGWTDGDSLWDYIDPIANDAYVCKGFKTLEAATRYAATVMSRDVFCAPRLDHLELREERIGRYKERSWETISHWLLEDGVLVEAA